MKIKAVVNVFTSKRDSFGNCYSYANVTNTRNGKSCEFITHSAGNASSEVRQALGLDWGEFIQSEIVIGYRDYARATKGMSTNPDQELARVFDKVGVKS